MANGAEGRKEPQRHSGTETGPVHPGMVETCGTLIRGFQAHIKSDREERTPAILGASVSLWLAFWRSWGS